MRARLITGTLTVAAVLAACSPGPVPVPVVTTGTPVDRVQPGAIGFDAGAAPAWTTGSVRSAASEVAVSGDRIIVFGGDRDVEVYEAATGASVWSLQVRESAVGHGRVDAASLAISTPTDDLVLVSYSHDCRADNPCTDAPEGTKRLAGVAAVSVAEDRCAGSRWWRRPGLLVRPPARTAGCWRSRSSTPTPPGSSSGSAPSTADPPGRHLRRDHGAARHRLRG